MAKMTKLEMEIALHRKQQEINQLRTQLGDTKLRVKTLEISIDNWKKEHFKVDQSKRELEAQLIDLQILLAKERGANDHILKGWNDTQKELYNSRNRNLVLSQTLERAVIKLVKE